MQIETYYYSNCNSLLWLKICKYFIKLAPFVGDLKFLHTLYLQGFYFDILNLESHSSLLSIMTVTRVAYFISELSV